MGSGQSPVTVLGNSQTSEDYFSCQVIFIN